MKIRYIWFMLIGFLVISCDDTTGNLGTSVMPDEDNIPTYAHTYQATSNSILAENIYARTSTAFLGKYTDLDFGTFEADFVAQFSCPDNYKFYVEPERFVPEAEINTYISFLYPANDGYFGDSLSTLRVSIYELDTVIEDDPNVYYYTDINLTDFYDPNSAPIGQIVYSPKSLAVSDSIHQVRKKNNSYNDVTVPLTNGLGEKIINDYIEHPNFFANAETFINNAFPGFYATTDHGDGSILYISTSYLTIVTDIYYKDSLGVIKTDSIIPSVAVAEFETTKEVVQANRFENSQKLEQWVNDTKHTYLKTPAGIFTEVTLPLDDEELYNSTDSLNAASITFRNYNEVSNTNKQFEMAPPQQLLMVRKADMYSFFEENRVDDELTSYVTSHTANKNEYLFPNISRLVITAINQRKEDLKNGVDDPDWNKVVLIPVVKTESTTVRHDLKLTSAKLVGGIDGKEISMSTIWTTFK